jgi:nitroimidazol reductase NimA-like FMN-containing flavoprotein (pyridoxamine 5'-phosphate oxidase superfamily)
MDRDELNQELGHPAAQDLLRSAPLARLAYNGRDGFPRVIPCGFYWTGESVVICTATTAPKARALGVRPNVAVIIDGSTPTGEKSVLVRGIVQMDIVDGIPDEYLMAANKTMQETDVVEFERAVRGTYDQMVRISITPQWARFFDFGAGRLPRFLEDLVNDR